MINSMEETSGTGNNVYNEDKKDIVPAVALPNSKTKLEKYVIYKSMNYLPFTTRYKMLQSGTNLKVVDANLREVVEILDTKPPEYSQKIRRAMKYVSPRSSTESSFYHSNFLSENSLLQTEYENLLDNSHSTYTNFQDSKDPLLSQTVKTNIHVHENKSFVDDYFKTIKGPIKKPIFMENKYGIHFDVVKTSRNPFFNTIAETVTGSTSMKGHKLMSKLPAASISGSQSGIPTYERVRNLHLNERYADLPFMATDVTLCENKIIDHTYNKQLFNGHRMLQSKSISAGCNTSGCEVTEVLPARHMNSLQLKNMYLEKFRPVRPGLKLDPVTIDLGYKCLSCAKICAITDNHLCPHRKQHKCPVCDKIFSRSWLLKGHLRTHTGERPYPCPQAQCNKAFADRSNLRSHMMIHEPKGQKHICEFCLKEFAQKRYLHKHLAEACRSQYHLASTSTD